MTMDSTYSGDDLPQWSQYKYYGLMGTTTGKQCVAAGRKTLADSGLTLIGADSMSDAAKKVVAEAAA